MPNKCLKSVSIPESEWQQLIRAYQKGIWEVIHQAASWYGIEYKLLLSGLKKTTRNGNDR